MLAKRGFKIEGVDLCPNLVEYAKREAKRKDIKIKFKVGDFTKLPYKNESFDKVICLWSSFNHLLTEKDQIKALNEIYRVLRKGGSAIMDLPNGESKWAREQVKEYGRVVPDTISGLRVLNYIHDRNTLKKIGQKTKFKQIIKFSNIAGRRRLVWVLKK